MLKAFGPPVYCYHDIVHNDRVVDRFRWLGVRFVDDIDDVPPGAPLMLSAHGSAPEVVASARERSAFVIDAVCPLVTKVHHEVRSLAAAASGSFTLATEATTRNWDDRDCTRVNSCCLEGRGAAARFP